VALADHLDALRALTGKHPDLDLGRVAAHGTGLGGWLAALAATRRGDTVRCAVARRPVTDWAALPAAFAERYLGRLADAPDVYAHHGLDDLDGAPVLVDAPLRAELDFVRAALT
jgi:dipeptidyl-peptidase 4